MATKAELVEAVRSATAAAKAAAADLQSQVGQASGVDAVGFTAAQARFQVVAVDVAAMLAVYGEEIATKLEG